MLQKHLIHWGLTLLFLSVAEFQPWPQSRSCSLKKTGRFRSHFILAPTFLIHTVFHSILSKRKSLKAKIVFWFWSTDPNRSYVPSAVGDKTRCWCIKSFYGDTSEAPNIFMSSLLLYAVKLKDSQSDLTAFLWFVGWNNLWQHHGSALWITSKGLSLWVLNHDFQS